jgi:two-component system sensor kinase FixL
MNASGPALMDFARFASESVTLYDAVGVIRYCNPEAERLFGWIEPVVVGKHFFDLSAGKDIGEGFWPDLLAKGSWTGKIRRRSLSGSEEIVETRMHVIHGSTILDRQVIEYSAAVFGVGAPLDVPAHRAARWELDISRARPVLAGVSPDLSDSAEWHTDRCDMLLSAIDVVNVNDQAIRLFGLVDERRKLISRPIVNLWPEETHAALADIVDELASGETTTARRDLDAVGALQAVTLVASRVDNGVHSDRVVVSVSGSLNDANLVRDLEASQDRYRNLISSLPLPVWQVDARGAGRMFERLRAAGVTDIGAYADEHPEIVDHACDVVIVADVNKGAIELFGGSDRAEFTGPIAYLFAGTPGSARRIMIAHFQGIRNYIEELKVRTLDGSLRDVLLLVTFPVPGERLDTTIIIMVDNTNRLEAETKLRELEAEFTRAARLSTLGELTASIAHEVKQPLSAILTNAQTAMRYLSNDAPNIQKVTQLVGRVVGSAERAAAVIGRIQDMAGKRDPVRAAVNLNDVVEDCLTFLRHELDHKEITVSFAVHQALPSVLGDRVQLQQIVVNLVVNSIQAMNDHHGPRRIELSTYQPTTELVGFTIRDHGPGIAESNIEHIFDGFFTTKQGGMGIGLAVCKSIVVAHGGEITVANDPLGGAQFRFSIPIDAEAAGLA